MTLALIPSHAGTSLGTSLAQLPVLTPTLGGVFTTPVMQIFRDTLIDKLSWPKHGEYTIKQTNCHGWKDHHSGQGRQGPEGR